LSEVRILAGKIWEECDSKGVQSALEQIPTNPPWLRKVVGEHIFLIAEKNVCG